MSSNSRERLEINRHISVWFNNGENNGIARADPIFFK
jgi:hypothetical protein